MLFSICFIRFAVGGPVRPATTVAEALVTERGGLFGPAHRTNSSLAVEHKIIVLAGLVKAKLQLEVVLGKLQC